MRNAAKSRLLKLAALFAIATGCAPKDEAVSIVAEVASSESLTFRMTNNSRQKISIKTWQAPWTLSVPYPLAVSAHVFDAETKRPGVSERAVMHANEILGDIEIEPGHSIADDVHIESRFYVPVGDESNSRYLVHWTYSLPICDLDKTFVHAGAAENDGETLRILFQETIVSPAPPRCGAR